MKTTQFRFPITSVFVLLFLCTNSLTADVVRDSASSPSSMKSSADGACDRLGDEVDLRPGK